MLVAGAATVWSTGGLIARHVHESEWTIAFWRGAFAALTLIVYLGLRDGRGAVALFRNLGWPGAAVALLFGTASLSFIVALQHASVATILFVQSASPLVAGGLAWLWLKERMTWIKAASVAAALTGVAIIVSDKDVQADTIGIVLSVIIMVAFAGATVLVRRFSDIRMAPATCLSALLLVAVGGALGTPMSVSLNELGLLFLFGAFQLATGFILFTTGARLIPAGEAILLSLLETILAPIWVWVWPTLREDPGERAILGGAIVVAAVVCNTLTEMTQIKRVAPPIE